MEGADLRWRLSPFLFLLYVNAYLDRVNVGFAALDMNRDFAGPFLIGWVRTTTGGFGAGLLTLAGLLFCAAAIAVSIQNLPTRD